MGYAVAEVTMPRHSKRDDLAVKVDAGVVSKARIVAAFEDRPLAEVLSEYLRPVIEEAFEKYRKNPPSHKKPKR